MGQIDEIPPWIRSLYFAPDASNIDVVYHGKLA